MSESQPLLEEINAVFITNISPKATEKTVSDFFSFCGKITKLFLKKDTNAETSSAVVQFETESASKTALLLTNALIEDRPISVVPYPPPQPEVQSVLEQTPAPESEITQRDFTLPDENRSKTSVVASLIAAGFVLGSDIKDRAKDFDDKNNLSLKAQITVEQLKLKAHELDKKLGFTEKMANLSSQAQGKAQKINEDLKLTEKANQVGSSIKGTATKVGENVTQTVQNNSTLSKGLSSIQTAATTFSTSVSNAYMGLKEQTERAIEEKKKSNEQARRLSQNANTLPVPTAPVIEVVPNNNTVPVNEPTTIPSTNQ